MKQEPDTEEQRAQGIPPDNPAGTKKRLYIIVGLLIIIAAAASFLLTRPPGNDEFNYANEDARQLTENRDQWSSIEWFEPIDINIKNSTVVLYWQQPPEFSWQCKDDVGPDQGEEGQIEIQQANCFIFLPPQASSIKISGSEVVIVRPQVLTQLELYQSSLRFADNGETYRFDIENQNSAIEPFDSLDSAELQVSIIAVDSTVSAY